MTITANDLKVKGVGILESMLQKLDEVLISVRGQSKYVVVDIKRYEYLRECELEHAYAEVQKERAEGTSRIMTAQEHIAELEDALRD
jgi:hypothetical protein